MNSGTYSNYHERWYAQNRERISTQAKWDRYHRRLEKLQAEGFVIAQIEKDIEPPAGTILLNIALQKIQNEEVYRLWYLALSDHDVMLLKDQMDDFLSRVAVIRKLIEIGSFESAGEKLTDLFLEVPDLIGGVK